MNWYVLYTASRAEKQIEKHLRAEGIEVYLPLHLTPRRWSDRVKMVEVPLFSSYIFVRTTDDILRNLLRITGISRIVFYNGKPAIVRDKEIVDIKYFLENARGKECEFVVNDEVQIASGPMKEVLGKVTKTSKDNLILYLGQIGVTVQIKQNQVIKKQKT
jgi:transcription antitermination factor NusG